MGVRLPRPISRLSRFVSEDDSPTRQLERQRMTTLPSFDVDGVMTRQPSLDTKQQVLRSIFPVAARPSFRVSRVKFCLARPLAVHNTNLHP